MSDVGTEIENTPTDVAEPVKRGRGNPKWKKGQSGNPGGRPEGYAAFKAACRERSPKALATLEAALANESLCVQAAKTLLEFGWGRASAAPEDLEAVREGNPLSGLTREQLLRLAGE
jgi:hypothetical protein